MLNHTMLLDYQPKSYMFFVFIIGKCVLFQVIVQFQPSATPDEWGTSQDGQARPRVVKRGIDDDHDDIPDGMCLVCVGVSSFSCWFSSEAGQEWVEQQCTVCAWSLEVKVAPSSELLA